VGRLLQTAGLTEDQRDILAGIREFVDAEIIPVANELEHNDEYPKDIVDGLKELGVFGLMIPEEYGGLGQSLLTYALVVEEIARGWMSVSGVINTHFIVSHMVLHHGTEEQKQHYLPKMAEGEIRGAFSMSEPGCGSVVSAITSKAVLEGDHYVLTGQKMWLTNGGSSTLTAVLMRTDEDAAEGASLKQRGRAVQRGWRVVRAHQNDEGLGKATAGAAIGAEVAKRLGEHAEERLGCFELGIEGLERASEVLEDVGDQQVVDESAGRQLNIDALKTHQKSARGLEPVAVKDKLKATDQLVVRRLVEIDEEPEEPGDRFK
jgi:hypothetical protein